MNYRKLGKTGLEVSEIGFGCEGFLEKDDAFTNEMFSLALEHGVNCVKTLLRWYKKYKKTAIQDIGIYTKRDSLQKTDCPFFVYSFLFETLCWSIPNRTSSAQTDVF